VRLRVRTLSKVVAIPSAAVQFGSRGTYVFLVNEKNEATVRDIVLGAAEALWQAVTKGLEAGDRVVIEGVDRLREGRPVLMVEKDGQNPPPPSANGGGMGKGGPGAKGPKGGGKKARRSKR